MQRSESIKELATALAKAQTHIISASKDATNPHFGRTYATLSSVWEACHGPLNEQGIAIIQTVTSGEGGITVETMLAHCSGEWITETLGVPVLKKDAQGYGSAITYGRRYSLSAIAGVAPADDDDGNGSVGGTAKDKADRTSPWTKELTDLAVEAARQGTVAYQAFWKTLSDEARSVLVQTKEHAEYKRVATSNNAVTEPA